MQFVQLKAPASAHVPGPHELQKLMLGVPASGEKVPAMQFRQEKVDVAPTTVE